MFRYDEFLKEEQTRQTVAGFGAALSGAANIMAASNAGYVNTTGSVTTYGPGGAQYGTYSATTYDPTEGADSATERKRKHRSGFRAHQS